MQKEVHPAAHIAGQAQLQMPSVKRMARLDASGEVEAKVHARVDTKVRWHSGKRATLECLWPVREVDVCFKLVGCAWKDSKRRPCSRVPLCHTQSTRLPLRKVARWAGRAPAAQCILTRVFVIS